MLSRYCDWKTTKIPQFATLIIRHSPHFYLQYWVGWFVATQILIVQCLNSLITLGFCIFIIFDIFIEERNKRDFRQFHHHFQNSHSSKANQEQILNKEDATIYWFTRIIIHAWLISFSPVIDDVDDDDDDESNEWSQFWCEIYCYFIIMWYMLVLSWQNTMSRSLINQTFSIIPAKLQ